MDTEGPHERTGPREEEASLALSTQRSLSGPGTSLSPAETLALKECRV